MIDYIETQKAWFLFSFSLGCWTLLTLLLSRRGERRSRLTMAAFVALLMLPPLNAYLSLARGGLPLAWLEALSYKLTWAWGPLMLMSLRQALLLPAPSARSIGLHALPLLLVGAGALSAADWPNAPIVLWLLLAQVLAYSAWSLLLLRRHKSKLRNLLLQHRDSSYYWLLYLALGLFAATCFDLMIYALVGLEKLPPQALLQGAALVLALYVNLIALFAVYQPEIFISQAEHEPAPESAALALAEDKVEQAMPEASPPALRAVELSPAAARELSEQLQQLVELHKPHQDEEMSLAKLAALLGVSSHQLSELLNLHLGSSFYDYLNELRYQEALQMLESQDQATLTVADIAYRAGFNNRNSFYKVFKDKTGVAPAEYRKSKRLTQRTA
ncbi:helix-turn-helix domain-containing protein [Roseateles oligotrophus]|uniref:AraC family transcriptional regulator n=1 Tax=Roseateles oligotrophus TaxID=1769250 RepID=A0ABT2YDP0_9BURK|nr:AraC family transcriptional regulator [Roseateles oligotrophus]MCV2368110.1 AraC family transcriptional regulator [Roseateles oligotrophus]